MFKKLIGNIPFNPSLINQVSFYAKRLRQETSIRRLGMVFIVLAILVQIVAIVSPPKPSLASSGNDLIQGGINSASDAVFHCQNNTANFKDILTYYNISCDNVAAAQTVGLNSRDYGGQLYSMGRIAYGKAGETPVGINGTNYWLRYLWSWDGATSSTYTALRGTSGDGRTFFILFNCGNLVFVGIPPAPAPKPVCLNWYQGWGFWYQSPDGNVNNATKTTTTNPCVTPKPVPVCLDWYQGWGFWYKSPDGSVNHATSTTKTNPCTPTIVKCPTNPAIPITDAACKPCEASQTREDKTACLELSKKARNDTQKIGDANGTTAKPGDVITYTLSVKNTGKENIDKFIVQENISDVLDYSDVVTLNGATKDAHNIISWPSQAIKAGVTIQRQFTVKVKNPVPSTPVSSSDPGHFDLTMTNVYGNTISIKVPGAIEKTTEIVATSLPNTGPGTTLFIGLGVTIVAGYFLARSRLMARELELVQAEYTTSGGI